MWQVTCSSILVCFLVVSGCRERSCGLIAPQPVDWSRLNKVVLCEAEDPFGTELILQPKGIVIKDKSECDTLAQELRRKRTNNYPPFSGILCYQVFVDSSDNVLLITHVVDFESTIVIDSYHGVKQNDHFIVRQEIVSDNVVESDLFVRTVKQALMKKSVN